MKGENSQPTAVRIVENWYEEFRNGEQTLYWRNWPRDAPAERLSSCRSWQHRSATRSGLSLARCTSRYNTDLTPSSGGLSVGKRATESYEKIRGQSSALERLC